jgi:hypothetical protein
MVDRETKDSFTDSLIKQDAGISQSLLEEQRMKIQQTLILLDDKARASQRFTIRTIAAVVVCYIFGFAFNAAQPWLPGHGEVIAIVWTFCTWAALITAAVAVTRYWTIHRPRLEKGRSDLQVAMFQELQRQISVLRKGNDG